MKNQNEKKLPSPFELFGLEIGKGWLPYKIDNNDWISSSASNIDVEVKAGEHVWFRGHNESYTTKTDAGFTPTVFSCYNGDFFLYGNLMSLIYGDD